MEYNVRSVCAYIYHNGRSPLLEQEKDVGKLGHDDHDHTWRRFGLLFHRRSVGRCIKSILYSPVRSVLDPVQIRQAGGGQNITPYDMGRNYRLLRDAL